MAVMDFEAAVIGAGPGGLVSALYLRRFLRKTVLVSGGAPRASWIPRTHNLLGYRGGVSGAELLARLQKQIDECGKIDRAVGLFQVHKTGGGFRIKSEQQEFTARKVILATGMTDVQPQLDNLDRLRRRGLMRYCPVCDAFEHRKKKIAVLAQDEHGVKSAKFLSRFTDRIDLLWPASQKLSAKLEKACVANKIRVHRGEVLAAAEKRPGIHLAFRNAEGRETRFELDVCYVALGSTINDFAFRHLKGLKRSPEGYLLTDNHQELPIAGLFAVGDCVEGLAQIAVAAGQGAIAATRLHNQLREEG